MVNYLEFEVIGYIFAELNEMNLMSCIRIASNHKIQIIH